MSDKKKLRSKIEKDKKAKNPTHVYNRRAQDVGMDEEFVGETRSPGHIAGQNRLDMESAQKWVANEEKTGNVKNKEGEARKYKKGGSVRGCNPRKMRRGM